jgi:antitoxin component YwqK of YwqJK toxin-antitoxin module
MRFIFLISVTFFLVNSSFSQKSENKKYTSVDSDEEGINSYEKYNSMLGGDSVRYVKKGLKCNGMVKDNYSNGTLKHKGYYTDGVLNTIYTNYWDNGQEERSFKVKDSKSSEMIIYYKDGKLRSKIEYVKSLPLKDEEYFPSGKMESYDEYDKSFDYTIMSKVYFETGQLQTIVEITDKKKGFFSSKEYYEDGKIKEEGTLKFIPGLGDMRKEGKWSIFSESGKLLTEEFYDNGSLTDEKTY